MSQSPSDKSHKLRLTYVWQAVEKLGRASAQEICALVASKMGEAEVSAAFKRNIYRDLNSLVEAGELGVDHFLPDGSKFEPGADGELASNFRAEYFSHAKDTALLAGGALRALGAEFYVPAKALVTWKAAPPDSQLPEASFSILLPLPEGGWLGLSAPVADRPFQVILARNDASFKGGAQFEEVQKKYGTRSALLRVNSKVVSRGVPGGRSGHLSVGLNAEGNKILIEDLGSSVGTLVSPIRQDLLNALIQSHSNQKTSAVLNLESLSRYPFKAVDGAVESPTLVMAGTYFFIVAHS